MNLKTLLLAAAVALAHTACSNCKPGPFDEPTKCAPDADAGSPSCAADQSCVPIPSGSAGDTRCFSPCQSGRCQSDYVCQPFGVGSGCGCTDATCADAGTDPQCHTRFLCVPAFCK